ncbi:poly(ethylene terephthalate) hydrolase family protein [Parvicella tangerina]|uniref:PET hydrolase/cutinase-like domain-containing protein n=1 Tax=Parvicella tangerina TaxID=2829795 RepID=A0A916NB75_9FLAO|nr:T9SS type A sorting domain-containing protein [Parvicella tangerina]CAG5082383.1 hypothetical protein CRYO30217_01898 [Parvicella tangerina]
MKTFFTTLITLFCLININAQYAVGHFQEDYVDPDRSNRVIQTEVYYPANTAGNNVPIASGQYPVIVFGHGFVMAWSAYENIWEELVPKGYIMVFPRTEGSILGTDHQEFGWDLQFLVSKIQSEGSNASSILYNGVAANTALMGHSMGGGAAFLAADSLCQNGNSNLKTLVGLAPAESTTNGVSSINSARSITVPSVIFSGSQDGVTPPADHHIPMYDSLASDCKTLVSITGGAHCYFANSNFNCDFGESTSSSGISISRTEQHQVLFDFVEPWLAHTLKGECEKFDVFQDSVMSSSRVTYEQSCNYMSLSVSSSVQDVSCNGLSDGSSTLTISGGTAGYIESWGTSDPNNLNAGTHNYTVTDSDGCSVQGTVTINEPSQLVASSSTTSSNCGNSDGSATLSISGGTSPYSEDWGSEDPMALSAGTYSVLITDGAGCSITESVTITDVGGPTVSSTTNMVSCYGLSDGSASLSISGGTSPYTEDWGANDPANLSAGTYNYTITDGNGCATQGSVTINEPSQLVASSSTTSSNCGNSDGSATLSISGGTSPYSENWGSEDPMALSAGTYSVLITDGAGCSITESVTITDVGGPTVSSTTNMVSCYGLSDGSASLSITGGTSPYTEDWGVNDPANLSAGTYNYTVTDGNGCITQGMVTITEPSAIDVGVSLVNNELTANNTAASGYQWIDCGDGSGLSGENLSTFTPSVDGNYAVIVTEGACSDTSSCTLVQGLGVSEPLDELNLVVYPNPSNGHLTVVYNLLETMIIDVYQIDGKHCQTNRISSSGEMIELPHAPGVYLLRCSTEDKTTFISVTRE